MKSSSQQTSQTYNVTSAAIAFAVWGGWAYFVNSDEQLYSGIVPGLTQGFASFCFTLFMVHAVNWLFAKFQQPLTKIMMPAIITTSCTTTFLISLHALAKTPEIFFTILPASSVGFAFCLYTAFVLHKSQPAITSESL